MFDLADLVVTGGKTAAPAEALQPEVAVDELQMDGADFNFSDLDSDDVAADDGTSGYNKLNDEGDDIIGDDGEEFEDFSLLDDEDQGEGATLKDVDQEQALLSSFDKIGDDQMFNINGSEVSKADILSSIKDTSTNKEYNDKFSAIEQNLEAHFQNINLQAQSFASEVESQIQAYTNAKNSTNDLMLRGQYDQEIQELMMLKRDSDNKKQAMVQEMSSTKAEILKAKGERLNREMVQEMGSAWKDERNDILNYAFSSGVNQITLQEHTDKGIIMLARKAMAYDKYLASRDKSLNDTAKKGRGKAPVSTRAKQASNVGRKPTDGERVLAEINKGSRSVSDAFDFLED